MPLLVTTDPLAPEEFPLDLPTQAYLGDSGIVLGNGVRDQYGCTWRWAPTNAWGPKPAPRENVGDRGFDDGQWDATRYYGPRVLPIPGSVRATTHAAIHAAEQRLRDAVTARGLLMRITEPGYDSWARMRQQGPIDWNEDGTPSSPHATFLITLYAPDPRIHSSYERPISLRFPVATGGRTWPVTFPSAYTGTADTGAQTLNNPGRLPAGIKGRLTGPVTAASIAFPELGQGLTLVNPDGPILRAGEWLDIDTENRQVLLMGQASRRGWVSGTWLRLPPRAETVLAIAGTGTSSESGFTGTFHATRL